MRKLSFIALLVLTTELALAQITLSVPDVNAAPGTKVIVPVTISDGEDVTPIQFALTFNTTFLSIPAEGSVLAGSALTDHSVGSNLGGRKNHGCDLLGLSRIDDARTRLGGQHRF